MKQIILLFMFMGAIILGSCERCTSDEPLIYLKLIDSTGEDLANVDAIYALNQITSEYDDKFDLALDLSKDSTVYIIERNSQIDTLTFKYQRVLSTGTGGSGYCMKIKYQDPESSLQIDCFNFEASFSLNPNRCPLYEISLRY